TAEGDRLRAALAEHADELNAQARAKGARLREQMAADR
ncbi:5-(carboxyamino)imidazole ribonucleotide mutase, partial [Rhizobium leguminosarum]|nr:5-(carboxyamino)imidazole ribonucleotide mutase [Rhizobium leguminosarum]